MPQGTIYTLEARSKVLLEVTAGRFELNTTAIQDEINQSFDSFISILKTKKIKYLKLYIIMF